MLPFEYSDQSPSCDAAQVFYVRIDPDVVGAEELLKSLYYLLWFPGYFGFNWDALYDCLRDLAWIPCCEVFLVHQVLPKLPKEDLKTYLEILRDAALDWSDDCEHQLRICFNSHDRSTIEDILNETV